MERLQSITANHNNRQECDERISQEIQYYSLGTFFKLNQVKTLVPHSWSFPKLETIKALQKRKRGSSFAINMVFKNMKLHVKLFSCD